MHLLILQIWEAIHPWGRCGWTAVRRRGTGRQAPVSSERTRWNIFISEVLYPCMLYLIKEIQMYLLSQSRDIQTNRDIKMFYFILFFCFCAVWKTCYGDVTPLCGWTSGFLHSSISMIINEFTEQQKPAWAKPSSKWGSKNSSWSAHLYQPFSFFLSFSFSLLWVDLCFVKDNCK